MAQWNPILFKMCSSVLDLNIECLTVYFNVECLTVDLNVGYFTVDLCCVNLLKAVKTSSIVVQHAF